MSPQFRVLVFGKLSCKKCHLLNERLDKLLKKPEWQQFEKAYCDVETEDGMVAFCKSECVNPSRIPAMMVARLNAESGRYEPLLNPQMGKTDAVCGKSKLYTYLGLQTDYGGEGGGVITPKMINSVLSEALAGA